MTRHRPATRPRGRPALEPGRPSAELCLNLTPADYDALYAIATSEHVTVQVVIRRAITRYLTAPRPARSRGSVVIKRPLGL